MNKHKKILLVGGGTGGHVTPLVAVIEELIASGVPSSEITLVTDEASAKMDFVSGHRVEVHTITSGKFHRFFTLANLITPFKLLAGFLQSYFLLRRLKPDVVLAKGAYLSAPMVYAAAKMNIPVYLHESDSIMGATNRRLAKYAHKIFVTFPLDFYDEAIRPKLIFSGLPIRRRFFRNNEKIEQGEFKKIMLWGGSQGAEKLNEIFLEHLAEYLEKFEVYHICGESKFADCDRVKKQMPGRIVLRYHLYAFLGREIEKIMRKCDLIISRCGATSLFELAAMGKAALIIPYPFSAAGHQKTNAEYFDSLSAAVYLDEDDLDAGKLSQRISSLVSDQGKLEQLSRNIKSLAQPDASRVIVKEILS